MEYKDNWTIAQTTKLIHAYKSFPNLWDINHKLYKNKTLRRNCLKVIANKVSHVRRSTTIEDVRAKLKTLRSQFGKEKNRRDTMAKEGNHDFVPKLWCYEDLRFVDVEKKHETDALDDNNQDEPMGTEYIEDAALAELLVDEDYEDDNEEQKYVNKRPTKYPWTREQVSVLLLLFKQSPLLYDTTHPAYAHPFHRTKAFRDILVKMKRIRTYTTLNECRCKIKTLRSQFFKEKRCIKDNREQGKLYIPRLWCYEQMKFLDDMGKFLEVEREIRDVDAREPPDDCLVLENDDEIYVKSFADSDDDQQLHAPSVDEQSSKSVLHTKCLSLVETLTKQVKKEQERNDREDLQARTPQALLGKMVEVELLKVPGDVFENVKWKIIKLLEGATRTVK